MQQSEYTQAQLEKAIENAYESSKIVDIDIYHNGLASSTDFDTVMEAVQNFCTLQINIYGVVNLQTTKLGKTIGNITLLNNVYYIDYVFNDILYTLKLGTDWTNSELTQTFKFIEEDLGMIKIFAGSDVPEDYHICDGSELSQEDYPELYAIIGNAFNSAMDCEGNAYTTQSGHFRIPDLRGRFIVGQDVLRDTSETRAVDQDYSNLGATGGEKSHKLTGSEVALPSHNHTAAITIERDGAHRHKWFGDDQLRGYVDMIGGLTGDTVSGYDASSTPSSEYNSRVYLTSLPCNDYGGIGESHTHSTSVNIDNVNAADAEQAHENRPPYYTLMYIIKIK